MLKTNTTKTRSNIIMQFSCLLWLTHFESRRSLREKLSYDYIKNIKSFGTCLKSAVMTCYNLDFEHVYE